MRCIVLGVIELGNKLGTAPDHLFGGTPTGASHAFV